MDCIPPSVNSVKNKRRKDDNLKKITFSTTPIRNFLLEEYEREVPIIHKIQSYRNKYLDLFFKFASILGEEVFYILSLPLSSWLISKNLAMELTVVLALSIGLGNMLKNTFTLPRPPPATVWTNTPPQQDHGLPSTHTASALSISFYFFIYCYFIEPSISKSWPISATTAFFIVTFWSISVMISRLYNGHHTPMDVTAGAILAILVLLTYTYQLRYIVYNIISDPTPISIVLYILYCSFVLIVHPQPRTPTPAYPETGLVTGTSLGPVFAGWLTQSVPIPIQTTISSDNWILNAIRSNVYAFGITRGVIGVVLVLIVKSLSKKLYYTMYESVVTNNQNPAKKPIITPTVEAFGKLFTYGMVSFTIVFGLPHVFYYLQLQNSADIQPFF
ncbi:hypothetical protein CYY_000416 [Polysphondylium violaceum]|uniref:Phosphatidic acid phosphatase type 2/haloperoxidase domain-containing protein n=1 Tax=Polysphondylium violaceum TaxID=133409 RepID=A0A8J4Q4X2_9MYCE|nr:hypothetical protein CYY_000416 [Polysphondylium violaceum]